MRVAIHSHHLTPPPDLSAFLDKHVVRPLARIYDDSSADLEVHLGDTRPARGGVDKSCGLTFRMAGTRSVRVEQVEDDLYKALLGAAERLRRVVKREVAKMRATSRRPMHRPLGRSWRERTSRRGVTPAGDPAGL